MLPPVLNSLSISVTPRAGPTLTHQRWLHAVVEISLWFCLGLLFDQAGNRKSSPRLSTAQHMRAFLAAMATTAFQ